MFSLCFLWWSRLSEFGGQSGGSGNAAQKAIQLLRSMQYDKLHRLPMRHQYLPPPRKAGRPRPCPLRQLSQPLRLCHRHHDTRGPVSSL